MKAGAVLALAAVLATGCGGGASSRPDESPGAFVTALVRDVAAGRYDEAWRKLYPPHQEVATREAYLRCEPLTPFPGKIEELKVLEVFDEPVKVAGEREAVASTAIKLRMTVRRAAPPNERFVNTFHVIAVDGRWTWFLPDGRYSAYRAGLCFTDA